MTYSKQQITSLLTEMFQHNKIKPLINFIKLKPEKERIWSQELEITPC